MNKELALQKLFNVFGEKEIIAFLKNRVGHEDLDLELIEPTLTMYDAYGPEETHAIFDALGINAPHVEDRMHNKEIKQLTAFRTKLWTYQFPEDSIVDRIEMGVNHIVFYPIPTQLGRRLLACMVATLWNPNNLNYFDVYKSLALQDKDGTTKDDPSLSIILDHADYEYSNPDFNRENGPDTLAHLHPQSGGSYHTHFYYHWQFPGLIAVMSILRFVDKFIDPNDVDAKLVYENQVIGCLETYSKHIAHVLLGLLPDNINDDRISISRKITSLKGLLRLIKEKGIFDPAIYALTLEFKTNTDRMVNPLKFTENEYKELFDYLKIKGNDIQSMMRIFLYDINTYHDNREHLQFTTQDSLELPQSPNTIKALFNLACCLNGVNELESLPLAELNRRKHDLLQSDNADDQQVANIVKELKAWDLRNIAGLITPEDLAQVRSHSPSKEVDQTMLGYRERVSDVASQNFNFTLKDLQAGERANVISRVDTQKALKDSGLKQDDKAPSIRDKVAADLFLTKAITIRPEDENSDPNDYYNIDSKYWENINAAVVHRTSNDFRPLMTTPNVIAVIKPGSKFSFSHIFEQLHMLRPKSSKPTAAILQAQQLQTLIVEAKWFDANTKTASSGSDANVFGKLGTFQVASNVSSLDIPLYNARAVNEQFLKHFGATIVSLDQEISYQEKTDVDLICAEYDFKPDYMSEYVLQNDKGGGVFIETHAFRQFFTPLEPTCTGGIILGVQMKSGEFEFAAFEIPYGSSLIIEPNTIHGDSFFKGRYAIALTEAMSADSVLMRKSDNSILPVIQTPALTLNKDQKTLPALDVSVLQQQTHHATTMQNYNLNHFFPVAKEEHEQTIPASAIKVDPKR